MPYDPNNKNQSADNRYYKDGNRSVINNASASARRGRPGAPLRANVTPTYVRGDSSTDQYYQNGGSRSQRRVTPPAPLVPANGPRDSKARPSAGRAYANDGTASSGLVRPLQVVGESREVVRAAIESVVSALTEGQSTVLVQVATPAIEAQIRTGLEIRIAREQITGDRYRDVRFELLPKDSAELAERVFGTIDPATLPVVDVDKANAEDLPDDFAAFVKGGDDDETDFKDDPQAALGGGLNMIATGEQLAKEAAGKTIPAGAVPLTNGGSDEDMGD